MFDERQKEALRALGIKVGIYAGVFFAGALLSFAYSYAPLHSAKNWKIQYLEDRMQIEGEELRKARAELSAMRADVEARPDADTFKMLQDEVASTDKTISDLESQLDRAKRRIKDLEQSQSTWKKKVAAAESRSKELAAEVAQMETAKPAPPPASPAPSVMPSGPAPVAAPGAVSPVPLDEAP